ncbi:MAG TPA: hypothetical protein VGD52_02080, partial [Pseudoduganella sp.]
SHDSAEATASFGFDRRSPIVAIHCHRRIVAPDAAGLRLILIYSDRTTYYFYLGAAAEELGYPEAAYKYYELAAKIPEKCTDYSAWNDACAGFKFPGDALKRMAGLSGNVKGEVKTWLPGQGPTVSELVGLTMIPLEDVPKFNSQTLVARDKFETDEEYKARLDKVKKGFLVVSPLDAGDSRNCQSAYDHAAGEYKISKCLALLGGTPLIQRRFEGDPIRLANMYESRDIKRIVNEEYYMSSNVGWSQALKLSREEARKLDSDLMVGIAAPEFNIGKKCRSCDIRAEGENLNDIANTLANLKSKKVVDPYTAEWKKDAFLNGMIIDDWTFTIKPSKVERLVIYRRSDSRVIYSFSPQ